MSTGVILTQTYVDYPYLDKLVAYSFFESEFGNWPNINLFDDSLVDASWSKYHNSGCIHNLKIENKDDYRAKVQGLYKNFGTKQLVLFGYIGNLDISVQQAMLKLLEEPPKNVQIIIYAHDLNQLLPTIKSRSQIYNLPISLILKHLDKELLATVKKKLPSPVDFCNSLIAKKAILPDLKDIERAEIDFWLWQNLYYAQQIYAAQPLEQIAQVILVLTKAYNYNNSNLQKKLALAILGL